MAIKDSLQRAVWKGMVSGHVGIYRRTGGKVGGRIRGGEILLLTTRGRRSARAHTNPLMFVRDGESFVVIASNGGQQRNPAWFWNVTSNPEVGIQIGPRRMRAEARTATPVERGRLWPEIVMRYPGYGKYQTKVTREIPLVYLDPRKPDGDTAS